MTKCDGNHGGPPCDDPECWNDDPQVEAPSEVSITLPRRLLDDLMAAADAVSIMSEGVGSMWLGRSRQAILEHLGRGPDPQPGWAQSAGEAMAHRPCEVGDCRIICKFSSPNSYSIVHRGYCANCQTHLGPLAVWYSDTHNATLDIERHLKEQSGD